SRARSARRPIRWRSNRLELCARSRPSWRPNPARQQGSRRMNLMSHLAINPMIALAVFGATAVTDAAYVFFNAALVARLPVRAANWSAAWYLLSAFAVISYTENPVYVAFAAMGSWIGAFLSVTWLGPMKPATPHNPP